MSPQISDSSDRPVTVATPVLSLPKTRLDLGTFFDSDRSDRNSRVPTPCARAHARMSDQLGNAQDRSLLSLRALPTGGPR
jgi:hypothetical protein